MDVSLFESGQQKLQTLNIEVKNSQRENRINISLHVEHHGSNLPLEGGPGPVQDQHTLYHRPGACCRDDSVVGHALITAVHSEPLHHLNVCLVNLTGNLPAGVDHQGEPGRSRTPGGHTPPHLIRAWMFSLLLINKYTLNHFNLVCLLCFSYGSDNLKNASLKRSRLQVGPGRPGRGGSEGSGVSPPHTAAS